MSKKHDDREHIIDGLSKFLVAMAGIREQLHEASIEWTVSPEVQRQLEELALSVDDKIKDIVEYVGDLSQ